MSKTLGERLADLNIEVGTAMTIDWQQVRIQAAMYAMQSIADSLGSIDYNKELIAKHAVELADALVAELKRSDDVYAECRRMAAINTSAMCENMTRIQK